MAAENSQFPQEHTLNLHKAQDLRYGENPHQQAAMYLFGNSPLASLRRLRGGEPSSTNLTDINAGIYSVQMFDEPAAVVIKHNNPSGVALGLTPYEALSRAIESDTESAFGGIVVMNTPMTLETARAIENFKRDNNSMMDIIAATHVDEDALDLIKQIRRNTAVYELGELPEVLPAYEYKPVIGGFIMQEANTNVEDGFDAWKTVTEAQPTELQLSQMRIAWKFISRIKSNAVIIVDKELPMTRGIGTGQTSRVRSTDISLRQASGVDIPQQAMMDELSLTEKKAISGILDKLFHSAGNHAEDGILASDSYFPFDDSVRKAAGYGIGAIIQQGNSVRDQESIDAANHAQIPMVFTGQRAFWH